MSAIIDGIASKGQLLLSIAVQKVKERHPTAIFAIGFGAILSLLSVSLLSRRPKSVPKVDSKQAPVKELSAQQRKRMRAKANKAVAKEKESSAAVTVAAAPVETPPKSVEAPAPKPVVETAKAENVANKQAAKAETKKVPVQTSPKKAEIPTNKKEETQPKKEEIKKIDTADSDAKESDRSSEADEAVAKPGNQATNDEVAQKKKRRKKKSNKPKAEVPESKRSSVDDNLMSTEAGTPYDDEDAGPWISAPARRPRGPPKEVAVTEKAKPRAVRAK